MSRADDRGAERLAGNSRTRVLCTVAVTLLIVLSELALLTAIYHRSFPVRGQLQVQATLAGELNATGGAPGPVIGSSAADIAAVALDRLAKRGLSTAALAPARTAQARLAADPANPNRRSDLRAAVNQLGATLSARQHQVDQQAELSYVALLVAASLGWFVWFRRLVQRHRTLQRAVTEQQSLARSEQRLSALVQNGADLVAILDMDSTISFVTPSAARVLGLTPDHLLGRRVVDLLPTDDATLFISLLASLRPGVDQQLTLRMRHANGRELVMEGVITDLLGDPAVGGLVLTVRDVTERHALEERLTYQAFHDALTGLANRRLFADRLAHALERRPGLAQPLIVLFCDLDDFKNVNDSLGHGIGDKVLAVVGERIRAELRRGDTAARLGGDEFAILMEGTGLADAQRFAERLQTRFTDPIVVDEVSLPVRASIGIAQAIPGETSSEEALRNADVAMYWAKDRGKATVAIYESRLHAEALDRLELRADLQRAVRNDELLLHYQPTVEVGTGSIVGFEALVRWQHPVRGLLGPGFFVPMAEETGLIVAIGRWVLLEACRTAALLQSDRRAPSIAVNLSALQLAQPGFVDEVVTALRQTRLRPERLVLEITESAVLQDLETVGPRLAALRELGVRIAIDDFGTGYSSLAYLSHLPVDVLKVDKSFIDRVTLDGQDAAVTQAIIAMGRSMGLSTIAEGVETAAQVDWLAEIHCPYGQGFFWSRPVDGAQLGSLLARPHLRPDRTTGPERPAGRASANSG